VYKSIKLLKLGKLIIIDKASGLASA